MTIRWKAKIDNAGGCIALHRLVGTFTRLAKPGRALSKVHLTPDKMILVHRTEGVDSDVQAWTEIIQQNVFSSYRIESSHKNNEIVFDLHIEQFAKALKSTVTASEVTLKLTKRGGVACLAIIIGMTTVTGMARPVTQAVPVSLVEMEELNELQHPDLGIPDVNLYLPNVKVMRSIVERMKALSDAMIISANRDGEAVFKVETALVSVKTYFRNLEEPHLKDGETAPPSRTGASDFVDASVLVKSVHQYLSAHQQDPGRVLMSITPGRGVVLHCVQTDATFTFYIPTKAAPG